MSGATFSGLGGPGRSDSSGVLFPVQRGMAEMLVSMADMCDCVKECVFIITLCLMGFHLILF